MKIVLIGASGFVGTRIINLLKDEGGYDMKNVDLLPSHFFNDITTAIFYWCNRKYSILLYLYICDTILR